MEICPSCNQLTNLNSSVSCRIEGEKRIETITYQCGSCGCFVRSENQDDISDEDFYEMENKKQKLIKRIDLTSD